MTNAAPLSPAQAQIAPASYSDDTPIEDVIGSPKAIKALKAKGINVIGDIRSLAEIASIPGVSSGVLAQLEEVGAKKEKAPTKDEDVEEGTHSIVLRSRFPGFIIRLVGGDVVPAPIGMPGRPGILLPIAIYFKNGAAEFTRELWLAAKFRRDTVAIQAELLKPVTEAPWRAAAIRWLRSKSSHRRGDFIVLE